MEENPIEALKNNIIGTYNVATLSDKYKAERFVMVSTDKAKIPEKYNGNDKIICRKDC